jgi:hypothetical protein
LLGLAGGGIKGLRRLAAVRQGPPWVGPIRASLRDGPAEGQWAVRHEAAQRHRSGWPHGPEQCGQVGWGGGHPTAGQEACSREAGAQAPEPLRAAGRLEASAGQEAPALGWGDAVQAGGRSAREGEQCVVALAQRRDRPPGAGPPAVAQGLMECGQAPVLRRAEGTDARHDSEAKRVRGSGQPARGFGTGGAAARRTGPLETAPDVQGARPHVIRGS